MLLAKEIMNTNVYIVNANRTLTDAARIMADHNCGCLPVESSSRLVGMITDRDIVTRAVARQINPHLEKVREHMTPGVHYCYDDQPLDQVSSRMIEFKQRRLPVLNRNKDLVGILTVSDMSKYLDTKSLIYETLHKICA